MFTVLLNFYLLLNWEHWPSDLYQIEIRSVKEPDFSFKSPLLRDYVISCLFPFILEFCYCLHLSIFLFLPATNSFAFKIIFKLSLSLPLWNAKDICPCEMSFSPMPACLCLHTLHHISMFDMHTLPFCCVIQCYLWVNTGNCGFWSCVRNRSKKRLEGKTSMSNYCYL